MAEENEVRYNPSFGTDYLTLRQERQREMEASEQDRLGAGELWDLARENEWVGDRLEDISQFGRQLDVEYEVPQKELEALGLEYDQRELDFIALATSPEDYQARIGKVAEDRKRTQQIAAEGLRGMGYTMLAGMTDPALLPLYLGTGGVGAVGRMGLLARTARAGLAGAAEGAAIEAALMHTDTQRSWDSVALAAIGGGLISGAVPLGVAGYRKLRAGQTPQPDLTANARNPEVFETATALDSDLAKWTRDYQADQSIKALQDRVKITTLQSIDARQSIIDELMPIAQQRMSRGERIPLEKESRALQREIERIRQRQSEEPMPGAGGTRRQRQEAARQRQARIAELEAQMAPLRTRQQEIQRVLDEDLPGREAWQDISRLAQGQIPERWKERIARELEAERAPYDRAESRKVRQMAEEAEAARVRRANEEADASLRVAEEDGEQAPLSQVGAARVEGARNPEDVYPEAEEGIVAEQVERMARVADNLPAPDRLRRMTGGAMRRVRSSYSRLIQSASPTVRGMAHTLLADPQSATRGHIPASVRKANFLDRIHAAEGGREADARIKWAKKNGHSTMALMLGEGTLARQFDDLVVLEIRGVDSGDEFIKQAAQARRDMLSESLKIRKESGERGFENVEDHAAYWSFLPDFHKMQRATDQYTKEEVIETLTGAYMNGRFKLKERTARLVAQALYARTMNRALVGSNKRAAHLSNRDAEILRADMEEAGIDTARIDDFIDSMNKVAEQEGVSDRAKLSLGASISHVGPTGLRTVDLIDTTFDVAARYAEEASAGAALARSGFKSRGDVERTIEEMEKNAYNVLTPDGRKRTPEEEKTYLEIREQIGELRDSIRVMYGESLDVGGDGRVGSWVKLSRALRKTTNLVALQWNGFASMGEASNQLVNFGLMTTLRNTRAKDFASFGRIRQSEDLQGMYKLIGAYGQFGSSIRDNNYTVQTMDEFDIGRMERIFNNTTGWISNKTQLLSGFRSIQHGLENVAMRSMQDRLVRIAEGKIQPTARDFDNMERSGLTRDQIDQVLTHIRDNPEYVNVDGEQVRVFSGNGMDPSLREDLSAAMTHMLSRNMQRSFVGETPIWMSKEIGKLLTQFRSFTIVSIEKQLAAGLRGDKVGMFMKTMYGMLIGAGAYYSRLWVRAQNEEDPEEYWEKYTDPAVAATGIANMTPHLGLMGMGMELGYLSGVLDSDGASVASRSGTRPLTLEGMLPSVGVASDAATAFRDLISAGASLDSEDTAEALKDVYGILPMVNSAAIGTAMALANSATD